MSELAHIVAIAEHMLDHFGEAAAGIMDARARHHREHDEEDGALLWQRVGTAIRELQRLRGAR